MLKRTIDSVNESSYRKKQKLTNDQIGDQAPREIKTVQDLKTCLVWDQVLGPQILGQNIKTFKTFLDSLAYSEDETDRAHKRTLLIDYIGTGVTSAESRDVGHFTSLLQAWRFAAQSKTEGLYCAITAVLALLLKTTSNYIEFREYGNRLCNFLLEEDQIHIIDRGLNISKLRDHVISPCLRLLTEIVLYDGGAAAKVVFLRREITFKRLELFLLMRNGPVHSTSDGLHNPSVRKNALRYLLANLRLQDQVAKPYLLSQRRIIRAVFQDIQNDPPSVINEILGTFKKHVVLDQALSHVTKSSVFTDWILTRIATLYDYQEEDNDVNKVSNIQDLAHSFLLSVCSSADDGVLLSPAAQFDASLPEDLDLESRGVKSGLNLDLSTKKLWKHRHVKNVTLASFIQGLRPHTSVKQNELIVSIFQAAPELVADYFSKKKSLYFEPKLTTTWIGYSMMLLSIIQLPIDGQHLRAWSRGHDCLPPPLPFLMENILPSPLTQKALTRCLNQSTTIITYFAIRMLVAAFQKFEKTHELLIAASVNFEDRVLYLWQQAISKLKFEFGKRCPKMSHLIKVFRCCPKENSLLKEVSTRLLAIYYRVVPHLALKERFDVSAAISDAFGTHEHRANSTKGMNLHAMEHFNILDIATCSPDMRWWHKIGATSLSPFTTVLKFHVDNNPLMLPINRVTNLLQPTLDDIAFLASNKTASSLQILLSSLRKSGQWEPEGTLYEFLDECLVRLAKKSVKYYDDLMTMIYETGCDYADVKNCSIFLFLAVVLEQWPFLVKSASSHHLQNVIGWLVRYLGCSTQAGENSTLLSYIRDRIQQQVSGDEARLLLQKPSKETERTPLTIMPSVLNSALGMNATEPISRFSKPETNARQSQSIRSEISVNSIPPAEVNHEYFLTAWTQKDIGQAILDGDVGSLVLCLCSKYDEVRRQALNDLKRILGKLKKSYYTEWQQTYILLGEVIDATTPQNPLPYFAGVMAARSLTILSDPSHTLYVKVNKFLNRTPRWDLSKLPSYWVDRILLHPPDDDNAYYEEFEWLLDTLVDGLRTPNDMETYRRCHVFERLLSISVSPSKQKSCLTKMITLLHRCTYVEGSSTLITRCGLLSWIDLRATERNTPAVNVGVLGNLAHRVYETSEKDRVDAWSGGTIKALLDNMPKETLA